MSELILNVSGMVMAVCRNPGPGLPKPVVEAIELVADWGVAGDYHAPIPFVGADLSRRGGLTRVLKGPLAQHIMLCYLIRIQYVYTFLQQWWADAEEQHWRWRVEFCNHR